MEQIDLNLPQRQSKKGLLVIFFKVLIPSIKSFLPLILILFFRESDEHKTLKIGLVFIAVFTFLIIASVINFLYFKFYINSNSNEFIIEKGWLNKSKTVIKLDKIQQVNLNQKFLHRVLNLYSVEVDTAGSSKTEAKIYAVSGAVAHALKSKLLEKEFVINTDSKYNDAVLETINSDINNNKRLIEISFSSLVKIGLTRNYLQTFSLLLVLFFQVLEKARDYYRDEEENVISNFGEYLEQNFTLVILPLVLLMVFVVVLIINLVRTLLKYYNYKIQVVNRKLFISYGLFETKNTIIKSQRVQILKITQNYFQKKLNVLMMKILQTDSEENSSKKGIGIDIPGVNQNEKNAILSQIFNKEIELENGIKPSIRKFVVHFIWFSVFPTLVYLIVSYLNFESIYLFAAIPLFLFTGLYQWITYKNAVFYFTEHFIIKKSGFWDVTYSIIEPHKIQKIATYQRIWHLNINLSSVVLYTAGGFITFSIADETEIRNRVNFWLYNIEKHNLNWM
ncbi:PH domain-containing protein [Flavobacterium sp. I3-2]|uniref:PH domain-containing protein n=1 Tax=Flavobacterium sp. I3-2 TaxID=2748319 RepID=UPI0015AC537F|nr:PH domain-containing protein [Flavobacterium sp. I3-2]